MQILDEWWKEVDIEKMRSVLIKDFGALMMRKGIISKTFEVIGMVKQTIGDKVELEGRINRHQYDRIFAKAFLRGALMNTLYFIKK